MKRLLIAALTFAAAPMLAQSPAPGCPFPGSIQQGNINYVANELPSPIIGIPGAIPGSFPITFIWFGTTDAKTQLFRVTIRYSVPGSNGPITSSVTIPRHSPCTGASFPVAKSAITSILFEEFEAPASAQEFSVTQ